MRSFTVTMHNLQEKPVDAAMVEAWVPLCSTGQLPNGAQNWPTVALAFPNLGSALCKSYAGKACEGPGLILCLFGAMSEMLHGVVRLTL